MCIHAALFIEEACELCSPHATRQTFNPYTREPTRKNEDPMPNTDRAYPVPAEVAAALTTGRRELLGMLETSILDGSRTLTKAETIGVLRTLGDYAMAHHRDLQVMNTLFDNVHVMEDAAKGLMGLAQQVRESVRLVQTDGG